MWRRKIDFAADVDEEARETKGRKATSGRESIVSQPLASGKRIPRNGAKETMKRGALKGERQWNEANRQRLTPGVRAQAEKRLQPAFKERTPETGTGKETREKGNRAS